MQEKLAISVEEAGRLLGLSRGSAYEAVMTGQLPAIRVGRRLLVPVERLKERLNGINEHVEIGSSD